MPILEIDGAILSLFYTAISLWKKYELGFMF